MQGTESICKFLSQFVDEISPNDADFLPLIEPTDWIRNRLLKFRWIEKGQLDGQEVFNRVIRSGSTERNTSLRPVHDVDLLAYSMTIIFFWSALIFLFHNVSAFGCTVYKALLCHLYLHYDCKKLPPLRLTKHTQFIR